MSGPNSGQPHIEACLGCTPGFWKNNFHAWPVGDPGLQVEGVEDLYTGECTQINGNEDNEKWNCKTWDFTTGTKFVDVFPNAAAALGLVSYEGSTLSLMGVLWFGVKKGNEEVPFAHAFGAHIVAGLFNAATFSEEYGYTAQAFVDMIELAFGSMQFPNGVNSLHELKDILDEHNNRGCPIDAHGNAY